MNEEEILNKIELVKSFIDNHYEFIKNCIRQNLEEDKNNDSLNAKFKSVKAIKDKFYVIFKDEIQLIEDNNIDNLPGFEDSEYIEQTEED